MTEYVFGYGSLAGISTGCLGVLVGWARGWHVAMDNARTIPGYKYYLAADGSRPDVCVAFLDITVQPGSEVNGVCFAVDAAVLSRLDARERNYRRVDVTDQLLRPEGRTWAYSGLETARARAVQARRAGRLVVARPYLDGVLTSFAAHGDEAVAAFEATTEPPGVEVLDLTRVDVAPVRTRRRG